MQPTLFDFGPKPPRAKPRVMMHVSDASCCGDEDGSHEVCFACAKCGHETEWVTVRNVTEGRRGWPCPVCNKEPDHA